MTTISREKVIGKFAGKWKSVNTTAKISKNNRNKRERKSQGKRARIG